MSHVTFGPRQMATLDVQSGEIKPNSKGVAKSIRKNDVVDVYNDDQKLVFEDAIVKDVPVARARQLHPNKSITLKSAFEDKDVHIPGGINNQSYYIVKKSNNRQPVEEGLVDDDEL